MYRGSTNAYAHHLDFQYNNFGDVFSIVKKGPYWWILAYPIGGNIFFLNVPHLLWRWDFVDIYLAHLGTSINVVFLASKTLFSLIGIKKKNFFINP
jgi:hypothetical protein